jgi:hypothetical protein
MSSQNAAAGIRRGARHKILSDDLKISHVTQQRLAGVIDATST